MSSDGEDRRPIARSREGRRRWAPRRERWSPSHSGRRTPSRSPPRSGRRRTPSRSPTPHRAEVDRDRRNPGRRALTIGRSRSPSRRRALTIGRSRSPARRARRSCRSRSRTRSEEREDSTCCRDRQLDGPERDHQGYTSEEEEEEEEDYFVRIGRHDRRLFSCAQCNNLLSSPVHECVDGHVICGACHALENERAGEEEDDDEREAMCRVCGSTSYGRSRAAEDLLHGIRFACRNYDYGCPAFRPRHAVAAHERACRYAPCFCPARRCGFPGGPPDELERHLTAHHGWAAVGFRYGQPFRVRLHQTRSVLRADDDDALFHLCAAWDRGATALSMVWIRPDDNDAAAAGGDEFTYEVKTPRVEGRPHRMQMQAAVLGTSFRYGRADVNQVRVTVPDDMFPPDGPDADFVEVRVDKVVAPAAAAN